MSHDKALYKSTYTLLYFTLQSTCRGTNAPGADRARLVCKKTCTTLMSKDSFSKQLEEKQREAS